MTESEMRDRITRLEEGEKRREAILEDVKADIKELGLDIKCFSAKIDKMFQKLGECRVACSKDLANIERKLEGTKGKLFMLSSGVAIVAGIIIKLALGAS